MDSKGNAGVLWIFVIFMVFILGIMYIVFANPFDTISNKIVPSLSGDTLTSANKVISLWRVLPIILILVVIVIGVIGTFRRQPDAGYI